MSHSQSPQRLAPLRRKDVDPNSHKPSRHATQPHSRPKPASFLYADEETEPEPRSSFSDDSDDEFLPPKRSTKSSLLGFLGSKKHAASKAPSQQYLASLRYAPVVSTPKTLRRRSRSVGSFAQMTQRTNSPVYTLPSANHSTATLARTQHSSRSRAPSPLVLKQSNGKTDAKNGEPDLPLDYNHTWFYPTEYLARDAEARDVLRRQAVATSSPRRTPVRRVNAPSPDDVEFKRKRQGWFEEMFEHDLSRPLDYVR
ncbi:hypothetical protein HMN09_00282900 [Mycena chlorophos]|uniref:Uncharacterized protein n=1 Tax=Mycena chlorophos TaxID=658473 RepID=A0A8H6TLU2_MYCCL|nr:hypothetical protein HMN09_00282900 [Mycena chlorophos]